MEIIAVLLLAGIFIIAEQAVFRKNVLKNVTYTARFSVNEAMEGDEIEIVEEIENNKWLPVPWVKTELSTSRWLEFSGSSAARASDARFVPSVFSLKPHQKCTRTRHIKALKRGMFRLESVSIVGSDLLGTVSVSRAISVDEQIRILPAPYDTDETYMSDRELYGEITARRFICEDPFMISGAREYTGREPMNKIHWSSTARCARLMVFNDECTTDNRAAVLMNMQRAPGGDPRPVINGDLETYIKAAAYIFDVLCERHMETDFYANGSHGGGIIAKGGTEKEDYMRLLRVLSDIECRCDNDFERFVSNFDFSDRTDIFIITSYIDERMLCFAAMHRRLGRNVVFYCNDDSADDPRILHIGRVGRYYYMND